MFSQRIIFPSGPSLPPGVVADLKTGQISFKWQPLLQKAEFEEMERRLIFETLVLAHSGWMDYGFAITLFECPGSLSPEQWKELNVFITKVSGSQKWCLSPELINIGESHARNATWKRAGASLLSYIQFLNQFSQGRRPKDAILDGKNPFEALSDEFWETEGYVRKSKWDKQIGRPLEREFFGGYNPWNDKATAILKNLASRIIRLFMKVGFLDRRPGMCRFLFHC
jgi:hypothetical protein